MAINTTTRQTTAFTTGNNFAFAFKVYAVGDVKVIQIQTSNGAETELNITTNYTVALNDDQDGNPGGTVTLVSNGSPQNLATGYNIVITSKVSALQQTEITNQGGFFPEVINDVLDKAVILSQQQQNILDQTIRFPLTQSVSGLEITENAASRAGKSFRFDSSGNLELYSATSVLEFTQAEKDKLAAIDNNADISTTQTLTNKTINLANNTLTATYAQLTSGITGFPSHLDNVKLNDAQTVTNKTINANNNVIQNLETDNFKANVIDTDLTSLAADDHNTLASAKAIKTYVDSNAGVNATNVNAAGAVMNSDTTTTSMQFVVDDDNMSNASNSKVPTQESVKAYVDNQIAGVPQGDITNVTAGTGLSGGGSSGSLTIDIDSTVATLTGSQTLTNKTIALGNNTVSGTLAQFNTAVSDATFVSTTGSETLTNKTIVLGNNTVSGALADGITATTQSAGNNSTKVATTAYTDIAISNLVASAPDTLNTLNELATALGNDANFSTTVTTSIAAKMPTAGGTFTGDVTFQGDTSGRNIEFDKSEDALKFANDTKAIFGSNLEIYSQASGNHSVINEKGSGSLLVQAEQLELRDTDANLYFAGQHDGFTALYHHGDMRLQTTANGINVRSGSSGSEADTGSITSGDIDVTGNITVSGTVDGVDIAALNTAVSLNTSKVSNANHTGDVTGSTALTIADDAVTYAKMQNVSATNRILGRDSSGAGVVEEITPANLRTMINVEDGADVTDATNVAAAGALMDSDFGSNGLLKRTSAGNYTVDTNTYLTSVPSGYLQNLSEDTSPQLGGDLDMNSRFISSGVLGIKNTGSQSQLQLYCESSNAHYAAIQAPAHSDFVSGSGNVTLTLPAIAGSQSLVGTTETQTLTNKTINVDNNTISNIEVDNLKSGVLDTDLTSVSGSDDTLASAKAIKTYVDNSVSSAGGGDITGVTAGDGLTGGGSSGGVTLNVVGGTGIDANANDIAIDSTVATLTGTQTLTNKTIDADVNTIADLVVANFKSGVLDTDLASVSGNDDTLASAKAIKEYVDSNSGSGISDGDKGDITVGSSGASWTIDSGVIDNANIASNAAIAGSKIAPDFGSQNITTTGTMIAASVSNTTNGMRKITASTSSPSGGSDGDVWIKYTA